MEAPELEMGYGEGGRSLGVLLAARLLCGAQPEVVWWGESPFWKREAIARGSRCTKCSPIVGNRFPRWR